MQQEKRWSLSHIIKSPFAHWPFIQQSTRLRQGLLAETTSKSGSVPKEPSFSILVDTTLLSTRCRSTPKACSSRAVSVDHDLGSYTRISDPSLLPQADNGTLTLWDYNTGTPFQNMDDVPQPGSLEAEAGVFCSTFDQTGTRLITGGADKTIKVGSHQLGRVDLFLILPSIGLCRTIAIVTRNRVGIALPSVLCSSVQSYCPFAFQCLIDCSTFFRAIRHLTFPTWPASSN